MRVFSVEKFIKDMSTINRESAEDSLKSGWPREIEGKTYREIEELGYYTDQDWMEEQD